MQTYCKYSQTPHIHLHMRIPEHRTAICRHWCFCARLAYSTLKYTHGGAFLWPANPWRVERFFGVFFSARDSKTPQLALDGERAAPGPHLQQVATSGLHLPHTAGVMAHLTHTSRTTRVACLVLIYFFRALNTLNDSQKDKVVKE